MQPKTIEILKSFAAINQGIVVREGNVLRTMSQSKNIFGTATVPDDFPREFAIYNLNELLSVLSLFEAPEIGYGDDAITIKQGRSTIQYVYSSPAVVVAPPADKSIPVKDVQLEFDLTKEGLTALLKAAAVMKAADLVVTKKGLSAIDKKRGGENSYQVDLDVEGDTNDEFSVKIDTLKGVIPANYRVRVTPRVISFDAEGLSYVIALDKDKA
ncbi:DNA polymerase processivity factor [Acidovorax phage ACP17]|uniref:Sliding clamp n=1 Tax=Acidovorax phage ACP17 TaxID=2010329 RepID=A0A218M2V8_9CAUD|nr:DNA polymerase processivity factor [Acidovorax phage ACP17]ASD50388.1 hypothetical protein [Acidovorax phage ACP17]